MGSFYKMKIRVSKYNPKNFATILEALTGMLEIYPAEMPDKQHKAPMPFSITGEVNLCGGETDKDFANDLVQSAWTANGRFCHVEVESTSIDYKLPSKKHTWTKGDYSEWRDGI